MESQHHFFSSGGYDDDGHVVQQQQQRQSQADNIADQHHALDEHHDQPQPQHFQFQQQQVMQSSAAREEADLQQRIAQRLLTARAPPSSNNNNNRPREDFGILNVPPEPQPTPPWETDRSTSLQASTMQRSYLPDPYQALGPSLNFNNFAPPIMGNNFDFASMDHETTSLANNFPPPTNQQPIPIPAPPKSVTFGTHDKIHQWDEQLDVLTYVDDEFFNVAHFLIDIVGVNGVEEYKLNQYGSDEDDQESIITEQRQQLLGGSVLSRLFGCGVGMHNFETTLHNNSDQESLTRGNKASRQQYQISKKLVHDFLSAVRYRMEKIASSRGNEDGEEEEEEDEHGVTARTREVVRKINAYGLPLLPPSSCKIEISDSPKKADGCDEASESVKSERLGIINDKEEEDDEEDDAFIDTFGQGSNRQFFPVLPVNDDDEEYDGIGAADENDHSLSNQQLHSRSHDTTKASSKKAASIFSIPTPTSIFSSLLKPKSSSTTPSEEECHTRLAQIRHEISKAQRMIDNTTNKAVQSACQKRISKLKDERRFYQIIQERYKLQSMLETTGVESVRVACRERFKQLILELETLQIAEEEDDDENATVEEEKKAPVFESIFCADKDHVAASDDGEDDKEDRKEDKETDKDEDGEWYNRVLKYVNVGKEEQLNVDKEDPSALQEGETTMSVGARNCAAVREATTVERNCAAIAWSDILELREYYPDEQPAQQHEQQENSSHHYSRPIIQRDQSNYDEESSYPASRSHHSVTGSERYGSTRYHDDDRYHNDGNNRRVVLSPRSDTTNNNAQSIDPAYSMEKGQRRPAAITRHPVAHAVKSRTQWIG